MGDCIDTNCPRMSATFSVESTHYLASRSLYILAGTIESGMLLPGMQIEFDLHSGLIVTLDVHGIEFMRFSHKELVALTVKVESEEQREFMDALEFVGESLRVTTAPGEARSEIERAAS